MKRQGKTIYIYDPINNVKTETTYKKLAGITGMKISSLRYSKSTRQMLSSIKCYIIDSNISIKERRALMEIYKPKDEIWKNIDKNGKYQISNYGRVKSIYKRSVRMLMPYRKPKKKSLYVKLMFNHKYKEYAVHLLVARLFLHNKNNYTIVTHKNGNNLDNFVTNLKWVSVEENCRKATESRRYPVFKIDKDTNETVDIYSSISEAAKHNSIYISAIRRALDNSMYTSAGYVWKTEKHLSLAGQI